VLQEKILNKRTIKFAFLDLVGIGGNGRHLRVRPDDTFLVGYPKSGNTWLNFLVASLLAERVDDVSFKSINAFVADVHALSPLALRRLTSARYLKSHDYFNPKFPKVVHIVRHPYDVAVSYYYFLLKRRKFDESYSLSDFVGDWILGKWGEKYGTWKTHNYSWYEAGRDGTVHFLKYEDLKADTAGELRAIADHLGIPTTLEQITNSVMWCSSQNMAKLEKEGMKAGFKSMRGSRDDISFIQTSNERMKLLPSDKIAIGSTWGDAQIWLCAVIRDCK
tara:strand:+ start:266 stop:1096 length:831 start_codon:yes stop_codon:yes gene_type:complete